MVARANEKGKVPDQPVPSIRDYLFEALARR
jgi:hypothetical protein